MRLKTEEITKYFGTDGIRGQVGNSLINPEFVLKLGWAAGRVFGRQNGGSMNYVLSGAFADGFDRCLNLWF